MRSVGLFEWISRSQPDVNHEFAHGWRNLAEFSQGLAHDFEDFEFDVITSFPMETPPPSSIITMPVVSARRPNLEIIFKESWVIEPNYTVTVKWGFPGPIILLNIHDHNQKLYSTSLARILQTRSHTTTARTIRTRPRTHFSKAAR